MKTLILIAAFSSAFALASFAQENSSDSTSNKGADVLHWQKNKMITDSLWASSLLQSDSIKAKFLNLNTSPIQLPTLYSLNKCNKTNGNMPCYRPEGNFKMPVAVPDSTRKYTLLIKK